MKDKLANKHISQALDHTLSTGAELCLRDFQAAQGSPALFDASVSLYVVGIDGMPQQIKDASPGCTHRVCAHDTRTGKTSLVCQWASPRRILHSHIDQGPIGVPSKLWLYGSERIRGWWWLDLAHRRNNCVLDAFKWSGLAWVRQEMAFLASVACGPWSTCGHHAKLSEAVKEFLRNHTADDPLFTAAYPYLCHCLSNGLGIAHGTFGQPHHLQHVFDTCAAAPTLDEPGAKVKLGRWFQWSRRWRRFSKTRGVMLLALSYMGIVHKWWRTVAHSPLASLVGGDVGLAQQDVDGDGNDGEEPGNPDAVPPDADAGQMVVEDPGRSVLRSSLAIEKRSSNVKSLMLAARILCSIPTMNMCDFAAAVVQPVEAEHSATIVSHKTEVGSLHWHIDMANGVRLGHVSRILEVARNRQVLSLTMMLVDEQYGMPRQSASVVAELAQAMVDLMRSVLANELEFCSLFRTWLPYRLAGVLSPSEPQRAESLAECRLAWEKVTEFHGTRHHRLIDSLFWTLGVWPREMCIGLWEAGWQSVPPHIFPKSNKLFATPEQSWSRTCSTTCGRFSKRISKVRWARPGFGTKPSTVQCWTKRMPSPFNRSPSTGIRPILYRRTRSIAQRICFRSAKLGPTLFWMTIQCLP